MSLEFQFSALTRSSNGLAQMLAKDGDPAPSPAPKRRTTQSLHSPSSSISSSSSSSLGPYYFSDEYSPPSPATPLPFSRVPFSWEKIPGIPKKQADTSGRRVGGRNGKDEQAAALLAPPPPSSTRRLGGARTVHSRSSLGEFDPFVAALVECSKDGDRGGAGGGEAPEGRVWKAPKSVIPRNSSDLFGAIVGLSCKTTCAVSESIVYRPSPRRQAGNVGAVIGRRRRG